MGLSLESTTIIFSLSCRLLSCLPSVSSLQFFSRQHLPMSGFLYASLFFRFPQTNLSLLCLTQLLQNRREPDFSWLQYRIYPLQKLGLPKAFFLHNLEGSFGRFLLILPKFLFVVISVFLYIHLLVYSTLFHAPRFVHVQQ